MAGVADTGEIVEIDPPKRLVLKWRNEFRPELKSEGYARCTIELEPIARAVKLTITHSIDRPGSKFIEAVSGGWPRILSNLKSLLETEEIVLVDARLGSITGAECGIAASGRSSADF
jgi:uncharacterized protein YndB with AHSA1/START domain